MENSFTEAPLLAGWSRGRAARDLVIVVSPEGDLEVAFAVSATAGTPEEIAREAWQRFDGGFDFPVRQKAEMPGSGGWDSIAQIVYNVPAAESRLAMAIVRAWRGQSYITLVFGATASLSRRGAQLSELLESWKPADLNAQTLANSPRHAWEEQQSTDMRTFVRGAMADLHVPGVAMAVVQHGRVVFAEGFGVRNIESGEPVRPDTRFMIGSSTKPLTTLMIARLVAAGKIAWSTPVTSVLPEFALGDAELTRRLEMRHTVSASTGMPRRDLDLLFKFKGITPEQRLAEMKDMKPTTGFGETFQYSNYLVAAGGYAAARSYRPHGSLQLAYEEAMRELVFAPLGMTSTTLVEPNGDAASPHATSFDGKTVLLDPVIEGFANAIAPSGAAWSTVVDMAKYLLLELNAPEAIQARWDGGIKINAKMSYGLGLIRSEEDGLDVISHGGNTLGYTADFYFLPKEGLGVVVLTNLRAANAFLAAARAKVFELMFGAEVKAEKMVAAAARAEQEAVAGRLARVKTDAASLARLDSLVGEYECPELGPLVLTRGLAKFDSWSSGVGIEEQPDGGFLAVLTSPPWLGALRLQVQDSGRTLVLDGGQNAYRWSRTSGMANAVERGAEASR